MAVCEAYKGDSDVGNRGGYVPLVGLFLVAIFELVDLVRVGGAVISVVFGGGVGELVLVGGLEVSF